VEWIDDPGRRAITEHRPDVEPVVYGREEVLTVSDAIPGFALRVGDALKTEGCGEGRRTAVERGDFDAKPAGVAVTSDFRIDGIAGGSAAAP
jgi:hypothetical protein